MPPPPSQRAPSQRLNGAGSSENRSANRVQRPSPYPPSRDESQPLDTPTSSQPHIAGLSQSVGTRISTPLNPQGRPYWRKTGKDWGNDATIDSPSSLELLIRWLEIPDNWGYYKLGVNQGNQQKGAKKAAGWIKEHFGPSIKTWQATQTKVK